MSLILEALEKADKNKNRAENPVHTPVFIEEKKPSLHLLHTVKSKPFKKTLIFGLIIFIAVSNLIFLNWWLNRNSADLSLVIPTETITPIVKDTQEQTSSIVKLNKKQSASPRLDVTGIVWDEKEPIVLINSRFYKKGDEILDARIIDIQPHEVRFSNGTEEFTISVE